MADLHWTRPHTQELLVTILITNDSSSVQIPGHWVGTPAVIDMLFCVLEFLRIASLCGVLPLFK